MRLSSLKFELLFPEQVDCVTESPTPSKDCFPSPRPHVSMPRFPWPPIIMLQEIQKHDHGKSIFFSISLVLVFVLVFVLTISMAGFVLTYQP